MNIVRKSLLVIAGVLLPILLWALAVDVGIIRTFGDSQNVKTVLSNSGIYDTIVTSALKEAAKESGGTEGDIPVSNEIVQSAVQETFSPHFIQQNTEGVIDGVYGWLEGETPQPSFNVDLGDAKKKVWREHLAETSATIS